MAEQEGLAVGCSPELHVLAAEQFSAAAAEELATAIRASIAQRGGCRIGLAGGGTPAPIYRQLATSDDLPWSKLELFWGDERAVAAEDERSNYAMARAALLDHVPLDRARIHRIRGELSAADAVRDYTERLGQQPLDILLLGMGGDGHTASLFPDPEGASPAATGPRVIATTSPVAPHQRISLSLTAINEARVVYLLVAGAGKAARLAQVRDQIEAGEPVLPAAYVQPHSGKLIWLVDTDAAAQQP